MEKIFGCCDLRRGCILFAALQMMMIVMIIAALIAVLDISHTEAYKNPSFDYKYVSVLVKIGIVAYVLKASTVIPLIFGLIKRKYLFYQPWIVISFIELFLQFFSLVAFFAQIFYQTSSLKYFVGSGLVTGLNFYIFYCICTQYNKDKDSNLTAVRLEEDDDEEYTYSPKEKNYL